MKIFVGKTHVSIIAASNELAVVARTLKNMEQRSQVYLKLDAETVVDFHPYTDSLRGIEFVVTRNKLTAEITADNLLQISGDYSDLQTCASVFLFDEDSCSGNHHHLEQIYFVDAESKAYIDVLVEIE